MKRIDLIEGILNNIINIIFNCHFEKVAEAFLHVSSVGFLSMVAPHPLSACPQSRLCPDLPVALYVVQGIPADSSSYLCSEPTSPLTSLISIDHFNPDFPRSIQFFPSQDTPTCP